MFSVSRPGFGWFAAVVFSAALSACGGGGSGSQLADPQANQTNQITQSGQQGSQPNPAEQAARAASASCSFQHVYVTVQALRVRHHAPGDAWLDIPLAMPQRVDLLNIGGGLLQALGAAPLAAGHYSAVRLILVDGANEAQPTGGALTPLRTPAAAQSGLTIQGDVVIPAGQRGDIALQDFDACQSIVEAGPPEAPRFQLRPELRASAAAIAVAFSDGVQRVNTTVTGTQFQSSVAPLADGGYVIAWAYPGLPFSQWCAQRYDAAGNQVGGEAPCIGTGDLVDTPVVAGLAGGGFAAAWVSTDPSGTGIWTVQYRADGTAAGFASFVNTTQAGDQTDVAIAALTGGGYVITWRSGSDVFARRYDASGAPLGPDVLINTYTDAGGTRSMPAVAGLSDGGFVIAWMSQFQDAARSVGIYMQRFDAAGNRVGAETLVSMGNFTSLNPAVAALGGGGFAITWESMTPEGTVIVARQFGPNGTPVGSQNTVKPITAPFATCFVPFPTPCPAETQAQPAVAPLEDGGYVITWASEFRAGGTSAIYARRYDTNGAPAGSAQAVSTAPGSRAAVSGIRGGGFVIAWDAWTDVTAQSDVYARRFGAGGLLGTAAP